MRVSCRRLSPLAAIAALAIAGCASPQPSAKIVADPPSDAPTDAPAVEPTRRPVPLRIGDAPRALRDLAWANVTISGTFCDVPELVKLKSGAAVATSIEHGRVHFTGDAKAVYGDLLGDRGVEAALSVGCDNGGGTAGGQIESAYAIFAKRGRNLVLLGTVTSQRNPPDVHITLLTGLRMTRGGLSVEEAWYRSSDSNCCPTGKARTRWTISDEALVPGPPDVTQ